VIVKFWRAGGFSEILHFVLGVSRNSVIFHKGFFNEVGVERGKIRKIEFRNFWTLSKNIFPISLFICHYGAKFYQILTLISDSEFMIDFSISLLSFASRWQHCLRLNMANHRIYSREDGNSSASFLQFGKPGQSSRAVDFPLK
jgi:hypothetical protein